MLHTHLDPAHHSTAGASQHRCVAVGTVVLDIVVVGFVVLGVVVLGIGCVPYRRAGGYSRVLDGYRLHVVCG